jgi:O-antigen/teichoic acid export membrane protein
LTATAPVVATIATFGLSDTLMRFFSDHASRNSFWTWIFLTTLIASSSLGILWAIAQMNIGSNLDTSRLSYPTAFELFVISIALDALACTILIANKRPGLVLLETLIVSPVKIFIALVTKNTDILLLSIALMALAGLVISLVCVRASGVKFAKPKSDLIAVGRFAFSNWLSTSSSLLPKAIMTVLVGSRLGLAAVAWVSVPMLLLTAMNLPAGSLARGLFAEGSSDPANLKRVAKKLFLLALTVTGLGAALTIAIAPQILSFFGTHYVWNSTVVLQVLALSAVVSVPNYFADTLIAIRKDSLGYAIVNVGGSGMLLVSVLVGTMYSVDATAWSWLIGQLLYMTLAVIVYKRNRPSALKLD